MGTTEKFETGIFYDPRQAQLAVERLHGLGYQREDISVMMDDKTREKAFSSMANAKGSEGIATGATVGGILGAIAAGMTATGSVFAVAATGGLATPLVVGPLAAALAGLGAGGVVGGIVGGFIGLGISDHKAKEYEKGLHNGGILIAVQPKKDHSPDHFKEAWGPFEGRRMDQSEIGSVDYAGEIPVR